MDIHTSPKAADSLWTPLVQKIASGDSAAIQEFYEAFGWLKASFLRQLGADQATDCFHDVILTVVTQIQRGFLREPARVAGYVRVIASRRVAAEISRLRAARYTTDSTEIDIPDTRANAESQALARERRDLASRLLTTLPETHRGVLIRFYVHGQPPEEIQHALGLTPTQFRLIKSRAKARFASLCEAVTARKPVMRECRRAHTAMACASNAS